MSTRSEAFVVLAETGEPFAAVRELVADYLAFRDAMANELDRFSERGKAAFAIHDRKADAAVVALKAVDEPDWSPPSDLA